MDDESADIELLEQHLNRSNQLSSRMTSVLSKFDRRLQTLEKSMLPFNKTTQSLTRLADNIDRTLESLERFATSKPQSNVDESLIMRGPRDSDFYQYTDAIKSLNAGLAFSDADRSTQDARLAETGARKIAQLFTTMTAEACTSAPLDPMQYLGSDPAELPLMDRAIEESLYPVVDALRALPLPSTHPSHPTSKSNLAILNEAQDGYGSMRAGWIKRCLELRSRELIANADMEDRGMEISIGFADWTQGMFILAEAEYTKLSRLAPIQYPSALSTTFGLIMQSMVSVFQSIFSAFTALAKRSVRRYLQLAFSTYTELSALQGRWDEVVRQRAGRKQNELADSLHSLRAICLRIFPEAIADIKMALNNPQAKAMETNTAVASVVISSVDLLEKLTPIQDAAIASLRVLGDGNWNMGDVSGNLRKVGESQETGDRELLEHFTYDMISGLLTTITTMTKTQKRFPLGSIFFINNVSYLRLRLLYSQDLPVDDLLSAKSQSLLNANLRSAKATYLESNLTALVSCLSEDKAQSGLGNNKQGTKEKALRFFDCLDELVERHRFAKVLDGDPDAREKLSDDVVQLVIPVLNSFLNKHREKEFSRNPQKYIKFTPEEVERQLRSCYR
ncbi:hypothetical protein DL93DRAFT_2132943 [Clavulina sp. PMI_390]|nr:hypothetical protein DL93DRAFT_2132943 [Clavulina sp. PMI_390]